MKFNQFLAIIYLVALSLTIQACGGGNNSNGSIALTVPTTVNAGKLLQATATFTSTRGVQALPITFSCTDPTVVLTSVSDTNATGAATAQLVTRNIINGDRTVNIVASYGGVSSSQSVIIRSNKLVFNTPASASFTVPAGNPMEYFIAGSGTLVKYTDADGMPLAGKSISFKVNTILGLSDVVFHWNLTSTSYLTSNPYSLTTLSDGSLPNAIISLKATAPGTAGLKFDYSANFIISVSDPGFGEMSISGDMPFSITAS